MKNPQIFSKIQNDSQRHSSDQGWIRYPHFLTENWLFLGSLVYVFRRDICEKNVDIFLIGTVVNLEINSLNDINSLNYILYIFIVLVTWLLLREPGCNEGHLECIWEWVKSVKWFWIHGSHQRECSALKLKNKPLLLLLICLGEKKKTFRPLNW